MGGAISYPPRNEGYSYGSYPRQSSPRQAGGGVRGQGPGEMQGAHSNMMDEGHQQGTGGMPGVNAEMMDGGQQPGMAGVPMQNPYGAGGQPQRSPYMRGAHQSQQERPSTGGGYFLDPYMDQLGDMQGDGSYQNPRYINPKALQGLMKTDAAVRRYFAGKD